MRNYNQETVDNERKYAYSFDYDVMHKYMMQAFKQSLKQGSVLELGCFEGEFTKRITTLFDDVTCVDASSGAIKKAKQKPELKNVSFVLGTFDEVKLSRKFDNILLVHVLEHLDERVELLKKIKNKWLCDDGVLIVACPNAFAPSRQIAVKMGLIQSPTAVTDAEKEHGHRITYSLETLKKDAIEAGLTIKESSGVFFKAMANFQWDKAIEADIVTPAYLDGCYELGKLYPELCATIYLVCKK